MALNYEVKKKVFGFDQTKTEKYVAQLKTLGIIQFGDLCDEVTKIGMAPRGVVKMVLDGLIDTLNININKGFSVQLGDFGCFRPGINAKSQDREEDVKYNPQIQISAESETKRSIFREKDKTKRSKKESAQHSKSRNKSFVMTSVSAL